ncbi:3-hydroxyisobutyrate dehydrogenase [Pandoraea terrae]|uniref:3-hydroxyisobutyrate dehydrogenase n=1 Tax=Pandoraea terrae TaxID=1537710 RepID=A0A5E4RWR2_9BURK|nr:3-hydroxyisobutyrate dehydrogenase [Pandoraea terrae]VVD66852.1 3-hydroxyisobutyrate dehydrogenase [Pandoraea terrae]
MTTIGFIGLGNMGAPMAHNLRRAGHDVVVCDVNPRAVAELEAAGAQTAASPREVAERCGIVITMLPASVHVRAVYLGDTGVLAGVKPETILIDSSTIDPQTARDVIAAAHAKGCQMADAPVSGGTGGAQAGTLTFMVGADDALFERIKPVLAGMGRNIVHCGGPGNGQVAKICNNLVLGISMIGVAEAMALGDKLGIDAKVLAGVLNTSTGRCWSSDTYNPWPGVIETAPAGRGYTGGFGSDLMLKDLGLANEAGKAAKQPVLMGALAQQLYQLFSTQGHGGLDFSAIVNLYRAGESGNA